MKEEMSERARDARPSGRDSSEAFERGRGVPGSASHFREARLSGANPPLMLLLLRQLRPLCRPYLRPIRCSTYATVSNALPKSASPTAPRSLEPYISSALSSTQHRGPALPLLLDQYSDRAGHVLPMSLPYEHTPTAERRFAWEHHLRSTPRLVAITHCAQDERSGEHVVSLSSGFPIANLHAQNEIIIVTSADAFEEVSVVSRSAPPIDTQARCVRHRCSPRPHYDPDHLPSFPRSLRRNRRRSYH
jgi:hypothetical protein